MKVKLEGAGCLGNLRCPLDNENLMTFQEDDIILKDCEHYRWHLDQDVDTVVSEEEESEDEEDAEEDSEDEWRKILMQNHIATVTVHNAKFYLLPAKKAVEKE